VHRYEPYDTLGAAKCAPGRGIGEADGNYQKLKLERDREMPHAAVYEIITA
jgi:hypothetical protein